MKIWVSFFIIKKDFYCIRIKCHEKSKIDSSFRFASFRMTKCFYICLMNVINLLKNILLKSQIYVSVCATLLGVFILQEQESYQNTLAFILFLTFWNGYFFTVFHKKKDALFWNLVGFIIINFLIFKFLNFQFYFKWVIVLFLGLIYNADFFNINLREFSLIKTFYVGFIWAQSLVWFPLKEMNWAWFFIIFFYTSAITFPFEIRDLKRDPFPTLPKAIGIKNTKILSVTFLLFSGVLAFIYLERNFAISFGITIVISIILAIFSGKKRDDLYYSFFLESLSALPFLIYFILNLKN